MGNGITKMTARCSVVAMALVLLSGCTTIRGTYHRQVTEEKNASLSVTNTVETAAWLKGRTEWSWQELSECDITVIRTLYDTERQDCPVSERDTISVRKASQTTQHSEADSELSAVCKEETAAEGNCTETRKEETEREIEADVATPFPRVKMTVFVIFLLFVAVYGLTTKTK